jgi:D-3-phosphoglycerate dehydrogenase / 2-oxoglutarate reductase
MNNTTPTIAVTDWAFADLTVEEKVASEAGVVLSGRQCRTAEDLIAHCSEADAVITQFAKIDAGVIDRMQKARVIVRYGIGVDNVDLEAARRRNIPVCNIPEYCVDEVADHTLAFILSLTRQVVSNAVHIRAGEWGLATPLESMAAMKDLTVGIIGFGRIGREVVRRLVPFKCRVLVLDPVAPKVDIALAGAHSVESLEELLRASDIVSPHCPSIPSTKGMFGASAFSAMKDGAFFINVGRGDLADSEALFDALLRGKLRGAALDVFDPEPIPADHPIRKMPNVVLAAHIASASPSAVRTLRETAVRIAVMAVRGERLPSVVNGVGI